ncbi:hypothetical protein TUM3794_06900 [Shewanella colwelliana]|uniref:Uncharacterized protein n=1 Tax=Shewanella colwelliana TaxID=23 RepID=A0ABQ4NWG5_SHECO|nr:hypothetical protein [Shewanella colwelliana]GIU36962.1 hypothetical protein TUM3794_06900 [Shewanella colwelliana]
MKNFKLILILMFMSTFLFARGNAKSDIEIISVSMYEVLVSPDKFHGKNIEITGVYKFDLDLATLYPSKEYFIEDVFESSLSIHLPVWVTPKNLERLTELDGEYVRVTGEFDAKNRGYGGFNKGQIFNVKQIIKHSK